MIMKKPGNKFLSLILSVALGVSGLMSVPIAGFASDINLNIYADTTGTTDTWINNFDYTLDETNSTILLINYKGTDKEVTVPATATISTTTNNATTTKIYTTVLHGDVFMNKTQLTSVTVSAGVKYDYASFGLFKGCSNLTTVSFLGTDASGLTTLEGMFSGPPCIRPAAARIIYDP